MGCCFVAVSILWGYEGGEVAIVRMEGDVVVVILVVKDGFFCVIGYGVCLMEWVLRVVCFTCGVKVKRLEVDCASRFVVFFCIDDYAVVLCDRFFYRDWFKYI